jgi:hypothetical protein
MPELSLEAAAQIARQEAATALLAKFNLLILKLCNNNHLMRLQADTSQLSLLSHTVSVNG